MRRWLALLLALALLLCGCAGQPEETAETTRETTEETLPPETTQETTEETEPPLPKTREAAAKLDQLPLYLEFLNRGDVVEVVGNYDDTYSVIFRNDGYALVETQMLHKDSEEPYAQWTGYTQWNGKTYDNFYLQGEGTDTKGVQVQVLEELRYCYLVSLDDTLCYMAKSAVSRWPITGGSGGDSGSSGGADGGDISLSAGVYRLADITPQEGTVTGTATVKADGTEVILGFYAKDERVDVITETDVLPEKEGYAPVLLQTYRGYVPLEGLQMAEDPEFEPRTAYARYGARLFDNFHMAGESVRNLNANEPVELLAELERGYMVKAGEAVGFVSKEMLSDAPVDYGTGGGGNDGGGGGEEWSPPAL